MNQQGGLAGMVLPLALFIVIFYFLIIRPQKKKQKQHDTMLSSIGRGDGVITAGGWFGVVREVLEDSYILEVDDGVKMRILKSSISSRRTPSSAPVAKEEKPKKSKELSESAPSPESAGVAANETVASEVAATEQVTDSNGADMQEAASEEQKQNP